MTDFEKLMEAMSTPIPDEQPTSRPQPKPGARPEQRPADDTQPEPRPEPRPQPVTDDVDDAPFDELPEPVPAPKPRRRKATTTPADDAPLTPAEEEALRAARPIDGPDKNGTDENEAEERKPLPKADRYIVGFFILLCIYSMIELYSASSQEVDVKNGNVFAPLIRQVVMLGLGIVVCIVASRIKLKYYVKFTPLFFAISCGMMIYALFFGKNYNGAVRSFSLLGLFQIQPPELIKIAAVMIVAYILSRNQERNGVKIAGVKWAAAAVIFMCGLLFTQGLTNTLLLMCISLSMMLIGGIRWRHLGIVIAIYGVLGICGLCYKIFFSDEGRGATWVARIERFFSDRDGVEKWQQKIVAENAQEMYGYLAQAHGGVHGVGPGNSRETSRLPLAYSDYIYSIVVEDTGFIGGLFLLCIYLSLLGRAGIIAWRCERAFPAMLVLGMAVMIVMQALCHMAINTGVFPVSGQPLPLISQGGTSMLVTCLAFGIMLSISRYAPMSEGDKARKPKDSDEEGAVNPNRLPA